MSLLVLLLLLVVVMGAVRSRSHESGAQVLPTVKVRDGYVPPDPNATKEHDEVI